MHHAVPTRLLLLLLL